MPVWSLSWEDPLEDKMATHSSIATWRSPGTEETGGLQSTGLQRVGPGWIDLALMHTVQSSRSIMSDSLQSYRLQHARLPCPSPTPRACSNSCPLSQWCHLTISSSVVPLSSCLQSFPASGSFPMSQFFTSGGQSIELQLQHQSFRWLFRIVMPSFRIDCFDLAVQGILKSLL